jgi:hypothetical protein
MFWKFERIQTWIHISSLNVLTTWQTWCCPMKCYSHIHFTWLSSIDSSMKISGIPQYFNSFAYSVWWLHTSASRPCGGVRGLSVGCWTCAGRPRRRWSRAERHSCREKCDWRSTRSWNPSYGSFEASLCYPLFPRLLIRHKKTKTQQRSQTRMPSLPTLL